jgi:hypothetical protein
MANGLKILAREVAVVSEVKKYLPVVESPRVVWLPHIHIGRLDREVPKGPKDVFDLGSLSSPLLEEPNAFGCTQYASRRTFVGMGEHEVRQLPMQTRGLDTRRYPPLPHRSSETLRNSREPVRAICNQRKKAGV